jgi:hypothetical protein
MVRGDIEIGGSQSPKTEKPKAKAKAKATFLVFS